MIKDISYNPQVIEKKWRKFWEEWGIYKTDLKGAKKPFYNLMMYPYPSAEGLHVGNVYAFTGADIYGRFKRMQGFDVFEPIGFDSGGIHSENYAISVGVHPKIQVPKNIARFREQLHKIGCMYDWEHTVDVMDPNYYRWTQWIFTTLFKAGLAYKKKSPVTYCPSCKTTLADEQTEQKKIKSTPGVDKETPGVDMVAVCERCKTPVEKKNLKQWFFRITDYAERLLRNTEKLDWSEKVLVAQRNWIGKSEGVEIRFKIKSLKSNVGADLVSARVGAQRAAPSIKVFTTRPDTLYGCSFFCLAPEHPMVEKITTKENKQKVSEYIKESQKKTEMEKLAEDKEKTGVFTGGYVINPVNGEELPVYVADYVVMEYGKGAVMGVPAHDERDWQFARKYHLPIKKVVVPEKNRKESILVTTIVGNNVDYKEKTYEGPGVLVNSGPWNGWRYPEDLDKVINWLEKNPPSPVQPDSEGQDPPSSASWRTSEGRGGIGKKAVQYKLRDWCISRQRYWGPPIPMVYCPYCASRGESWFTSEEASKPGVEELAPSAPRKTPGVGQLELATQMKGWYPVPEEDLPVLLPDTDDYLPGEAGGKAPLARLPEFVKVKCPRCGKQAQRETDVSDTFLDSSWYFLRYPSTDSTPKSTPGVSLSTPGVDSEKTPFDSQITKKWLPVNMYIGGAEHSVLHLMYSRFITMALHDLGYLHFEEPFSRFYAHGLIIKDGAKMSKSRGNIVNPDESIDKFGVDALRAYLMFLGPFNMGGDFRDTGMIGMYKFLKRVYQLATKSAENNNQHPVLIKKHRVLIRKGKLMQVLHQTIKKVGEDYTALKYNTAIAALMKFVNLWQDELENANREVVKTLALLMAPLTPYLAEELWHLPTTYNLQPTTASVHQQRWPKYDPKLVKEGMVTIVIQVNGKLRDKLLLDVGIANFSSRSDKEKFLDSAKKSEKIRLYLKGKTIKKTIFVPGKLVNFVF